MMAALDLSEREQCEGPENYSNRMRSNVINVQVHPDYFVRHVNASNFTRSCSVRYSAEFRKIESGSPRARLVRE